MGVLTGSLTRRCSGAPVEGWGWPRVAEASAGLSPLQDTRSGNGIWPNVDRNRWFSRRFAWQVRGLGG